MNERLKKREILSFGFAGLGQNMIYILSSTFLMIFYTDVFKVSPIVVGTIFLIARIWDAINDLIMGVIVDNTRTRWGKLRPYLLFAPIPIAIITIITFTAPSLTGSLKIAYIAVTYILWGIIFTIGDVPYWGLSAAMTNNIEERTKLISFTRVLTMIGMGIGFIAIPLLIKTLGDGTESSYQGYLLTAIIISVIGSALFSLAFFGTKELVIPSIGKTKLKDNLSLLWENKPLLIVLLASLLGFGRLTTSSGGTYVAKYNLGDEGLFSLLAASSLISFIIAGILTPILVKWIGKKKLFISTSLIGALIYFILYFDGYGNLSVVLILTFLSSFAAGFFTVLQTTMIADSVDYLEWITGKRAEGLCFSGQTFFAKFGTALSSFLIGAILTITGFIENAPVQNDMVYNGIFSIVTIVPAIGCLLSVIPMFFYRFTEDVQKQCLTEITKRKESNL